MSRFNRILCWGSQFPPSSHPHLYKRSQRVMYRLALTVWRWTHDR